ncbi:unnamed protein product, partial [Ectocarpus sp. 12 AP-2014]
IYYFRWSSPTHPSKPHARPILVYLVLSHTAGMNESYEREACFENTPACHVEKIYRLQLKAKLSYNHNEAWHVVDHVTIPDHPYTKAPFATPSARRDASRCTQKHTSCRCNNASHLPGQSQKKIITITCTGVYIVFLDGARGILLPRPRSRQFYTPTLCVGACAYMLPDAGTPKATSYACNTLLSESPSWNKGLLPTSKTLGGAIDGTGHMPNRDPTHRGQGAAPPPFLVYNIEIKESAAPSIDQSLFKTRRGQLSRLQQHFRTTRDSSSPPPGVPITTKQLADTTPNTCP